MCGEKDSFRGPDIDVAPIEIRTNMDEKERFGHLYKSELRRELENDAVSSQFLPKIFVADKELFLSGNTHTDSEDFDFTQLFVEAKKFAEKRSLSYIRNKGAVQAFV